MPITYYFVVKTVLNWIMSHYLCNCPYPFIKILRKRFQTQYRFFDRFSGELTPNNSAWCHFFQVYCLGLVSCLIFLLFIYSVHESLLYCQSDIYDTRCAYRKTPSNKGIQRDNYNHFVRFKNNSLKFQTSIC